MHLPADAWVASPMLVLSSRLPEPDTSASLSSLRPCFHQSTLAATSTEVAFRPTS